MGMQTKTKTKSKSNSELVDMIDMLEVKIISLERRLNNRIDSLEERKPVWDQTSKMIIGR